MSSRLIILLVAAFLLNACKKDELPDNPATVQIFNALDDGEGLYANLSGHKPTQYKTLLSVSNKSYVYSNGLNNNLVFINQYPQTIAFYAMKDTLPKDAPVIDQMLDLVPGSVYSLFIYGTKNSANYLLNKDQIPAINRRDSTTHFRIINLSEDQVLSVNKKGEPHKSFINKLAFKELSAFIELPASTSVTAFEFEFRDYETGDFIASFVRDNAYEKNVAHTFFSKSNTLVFVGKKSGTGTNQQKVVLMNNR